MMAAISPSKTNTDETLSTLNYAKRAKSIKVCATKNDESEQVAKLEEEVEQLKAKLANMSSGVADTSKYEQQIAEMESFMKQTWDDKEKATQAHDEETKAMALEAQKNLEKLMAERNRRLKLMEDKDDVELSMQDLHGLDGTGFKDSCADWLAQVAKLATIEQRVSTQCRAVALCKDAALQDLVQFRELCTPESLDGGIAGRMTLQQVERKADSLFRELDHLAKQEYELEDTLALLLPQVQRIIVRSEKAEKNEDAKEESEEALQVLALIGRQLDRRRSKIWIRVAEDHRVLGNLCDSFGGLLECCTALGADTTALAEELKLELGGSRGTHSTGAETAAALARPLGMSTGVLPDAAITASSNQDAATCSRLLGGVTTASGIWGGWCPATDGAGEYLQIDLGAPHWIAGFSLQGRRPISGASEQSRPLVAKILDNADALPPERIFLRPPVRLIHDVLVVVMRHNGLDCGASFSAEQMDYKKMQAGDRQSKIEFFDLVLAKVAATLDAAGVDGQVPPLTLTSAEILGGKNTTESNRLLQVMCYLALRKKLGTSLGGLLSCSDQWVTRYSISWSEDDKSWTPITSQGPDGSIGQPVEMEGNAEPQGVRFYALRSARPPRPAQFLRLQPLAFQTHPGFRFEVHGWADGEEASLGNAKGSSKPAILDRQCMLEGITTQADLFRKVARFTNVTVGEHYKETQRAEDEKNQNAIAEKTEVDAQLRDAMKQLEEFREAQRVLQEQISSTQQKLMDAGSEKLELQVEKERAESQVNALQEKLNSSLETCNEEKQKVKELDEKVEELKTTSDDLQEQLGVVTEERDCARTREEELFDTLTSREDDLHNTNEGYVYLTERLHEMREELEEKIEQQQSVIETHEHRSKSLLDEQLNLRTEVGELKRQLADKDKALERAQKGLPLDYKASINKEGTPRVPVPPSTEPGAYPEKKKAGAAEEDDEYAADFENE
jgi:hypothetical protein